MREDRTVSFNYSQTLNFAQVVYDGDQAAQVPCRAAHLLSHRHYRYLTMMSRQQRQPKISHY